MKIIEPSVELINAPDYANLFSGGIQQGSEITAEYIDKRELEEAFDNADPDVCESYPDGYNDWGFGRENVRDVIRGVPTADVAPVVHGRMVDAGGFFFRCSECDGLFPFGGNYCPNCGAMMDGGTDNGNS